jgi:hypothetical protein
LLPCLFGPVSFALARSQGLFLVARFFIPADHTKAPST